MNQHCRMSPWTALFLGVFAFGAVAIASGTAVALYGLRIVDTKASALVKFAGNTIEGLPELIDSLPPVLADMLHDRRAPEYADNLSVRVSFIAEGPAEGLYPAVTITNHGDEVVTLLGLRLTALSNDVPARNWTRVVATPIVLDDEDWPGPLYPGSTRHIVMSNCCPRLPARLADRLTSAFEISELRLWQPQEEATKPTSDAG